MFNKKNLATETKSRISNIRRNSAAPLIDTLSDFGSGFIMRHDFYT